MDTDLPAARPLHLTSREWTNWSGGARFTPARIETPEDEEALLEIVRAAVAEGRAARAVGTGHSSSPILETDGVLVSLERLSGVELVEGDTAVVRAGTTLRDASRLLREHGLALHNLGDVDVQTLAGAFATGTHGTGRTLQNLAGAMVGGRLVTADGVVDLPPDLVPAARVSLGALGVFAAVRVRLVPAFRLHRREWCAHVDACLHHLDELVATHRNVDFYWYPRRDETKIRTLDPPGPRDLPYARLVEDKIGWSDEVLPKTRDLRFEEMEYALPAEAGPACFREVRRRVLERHRGIVGWRVLYRTVAADDAYLSPAYGRATVTISIHQNASLPFWPYFRDVEPIFRAHDGRPHWGKQYTIGRDALRALYPMWDRFADVRRRLDPRGVFLNPYLRELFA